MGDAKVCACDERLLREATLPRGYGKTLEHVQVLAQHLTICLTRKHGS